MNIRPVILCGGAGTRLWPLSREMYPKQLLTLVGENSLLQDTVARVAGGVAPLLICNENHRFMVAEQVHSMGVADAEIILEPVGKNTAPAIAVAAYRQLALDGDAILAVLPSDHVIQDLDQFRRALARAAELAEQDYLVTFGITPTRADTGYGYVQRAASLGNEAFEVARFVEKPDAATAESYLAEGDYYWNSGMFVFKASVFLKELEAHRPDIADAVRRSCETFHVDRDFTRIDAAHFAECPSDSIDFAVMEKTNRAAVVPMDAGWSDIGSWDALWDVTEKDESENSIRGDVIVEGVRGSYIRAEHRLVSAIGVEDLVVVETADAVLIASKSAAQDVKKLVANLKSCEREEHITHRKVFRPWGHYENLDSATRFQVKRICVSPGSSLSLQKHFHRAEHWTVVSGTAEVTCDDRTFQLSENESTFIPLGSIHRLANRGKIPLEIIEVQSGPYLGEDDIVRFEDAYGRSEDKKEQ